MDVTLQLDYIALLLSHINADIAQPRNCSVVPRPFPHSLHGDWGLGIGDWEQDFVQVACYL